LLASLFYLISARAARPCCVLASSGFRRRPVPECAVLFLWLVAPAAPIIAPGGRSGRRA